METLLYYLARALVGLLQALPLTWVARLGRAAAAGWPTGWTRGTGGWRCAT